MSTTASLTVEEFLQLPEKPGVKRELVEGVLVEMGTAGLRHELVKSNFIALVGAYLRAHPIGRLFSETLFVLQPHEGYIPDVSVVLTDRLRGRDPNKPFEGPPDLAMEVVSSETAAQLERKIRGYLRAGRKAVWVAYPEQRTVHVYDPDGRSRRLEEGDTLELATLLPGFQESVSRFFEGA